MDKYSEYGRIYTEICNGSSKKLIGKKWVYFKHPTMSEHFSNECSSDSFISEGLARGLYSESDKIKDAINGGWWSNEQESTVNVLRKTIKNLINTRNRLAYPSQKNQIASQIKRNESILLSHLKQRNDIVGYTAENYAQSKLSERLLIFYTYKDSDFKHRLFKNEDSYYDICDEDLKQLEGLFNSYSEIFTRQGIKEVAACGFFQNLVYLAEDAYSFWGKPVAQCTKYQVDILLYGKIYRNVIKISAENGTPVKGDILSNPEKFVNWTENSSQESRPGQSKKFSKSSGKHAVSSPVGATKEDLDEMGVKVSKLRGKSLLDLARENGGTLEKNQYLSARENS